MTLFYCQYIFIFILEATSSSLFLRLHLYLYSWGYIFIFILEATSLSLFLRLQLYLYSWGYIFIFILKATPLSLFLILDVLISTFQTKLIQNNFLGKPNFLNLIFFISNACNNSDIYYTVTLYKIQVLTCLTRDFLVKSWPEDFKTIP